VLARHADVVLAAVYAVPAVDVGDEVMAALHLRDGAVFDPPPSPSSSPRSRISHRSGYLLRTCHRAPAVDRAQKVLKRPAVPSTGSAATQSGGDPDEKRAIEQ
jgi:hypothetical protein